jgi:hypothetical protein
MEVLAMTNRILCAKAARGGSTGEGPTYETLALPKPDEMKRLLNLPAPKGEPVVTDFHHDNSAVYVTATRDSTVFMVVLGDITAEQARRIGGKLDLQSRMSPATFQDVVEDVLGESVNPGEPKGMHLAQWHQLI